MVVVTLYASQASFNFPAPNKFTGRYLLYIAPLVWLTALTITNEKLGSFPEKDYYYKPDLFCSYIYTAIRYSSI